MTPAWHRRERLGSSPRSRVWRAEFDGGPAVLKQIVGGADAPDRFRRELAALRLAARADPAVVPAVLATDPDELVLVLEYLPDTGPPPDWVVGYATALARLHATTTAADVASLPAWDAPARADIDAFLGLAAGLGVPAVPGVADELEALIARLDPAGQTALLHGDPCPANDLYTVDGVRFVDLEQASLGNGLTELAYLRIGFPTCWCVTAVPPALRDRAEAQYRSTWRRLTGADVPGALVDACAGWLIRGDALVERAHRGPANHLARVLRQDWRWGTVSARERLRYRLCVVADMARDEAPLIGLAALCLSMVERLDHRWPALASPPSVRPPI